jgi:exonuclease III
VVRDVILFSQTEIVCIQETKVANMSQTLFLSVFGSAFDKFVDLPAQGTRGGVLIAWKSSICQEIATRVDRFSVSVHIAEQEGRNWWFTRVYGPQAEEEKIKFLQELKDIRMLYCYVMGHGC